MRQCVRRGLSWQKLTLGLPGCSRPPLPPVTFSYSISKSQSFFQVLCSLGSDHPGTAQFLLILKVRAFLATSLHFQISLGKERAKLEREGRLCPGRNAFWDAVRIWAPLGDFKDCDVQCEQSLISFRTPVTLKEFDLRVRLELTV